MSASNDAIRLAAVRGGAPTSLVRACLLAAACVAALGSLAPLAAQTPNERAPRPYRGLFGRETPTTDRHKYLDWTFSLDAGRDSNLRFGRGAPASPQQQVAGEFGSLSTALHYDQQARRTRFDATVFARARRYFLDRQVNISEYGANVGLDWELSRRSRLAVMQGVGVYPHFQLNLLPDLFGAQIGELPPQNLDWAVADEQTLGVFTRAEWLQQFGRRSRLQLSGSRRAYGFLDRDNVDTQLVQLGASFLHDLTRNLALRLGYRRVRGEFNGTSNRQSRDDIDVGVDYRRNLSFSRRTSLGFQTGSTVLHRENGPSQYRLNGAARLHHQIGRTWEASALLAHGTGFVEGLDGPLAYDAAVAELRGQLNRRMELSFDAGYSRGSSAIVRERRYSTTRASAAYQLALARSAAVQAQYYYYYYNLDPELLGAVFTDRTLDRHGVRVGLTWWLPIVR